MNVELCNLFHRGTVCRAHLSRVIKSAKT